ncbi:DDE-type integrase/transposase/recombinase [Arthrobacter ramosus]|uniref:DDE-type integrase/transposase/recombinase n=1 Tax=Arthrobacter ramosus TaxID=1672 RepID=A0ABV5Y0S5_ARTRM|nr:DDE-type integrase/transposase/recombinase [Arthrobacter ramosus]
MTDAKPQRGPLARKDRAEKTALFRYQLIRGAADKTLTGRQRGPMVRALAAAEHTGPDGQPVRYSRETLDRWISAWHRDGFDGLKPRERAAGPATPETVLSLAATLKLERPQRTAAQVRRIMTETLGDAPSESTLLRHFRTLEIPTGTAAAATGRFEAGRPNEIWVGDGLHGPRIGGRKTYLFAFLDDHSRLVTAARWAFAEDAVRLSAALRPALQTHGIPDAVYVDNGSAFVDSSLARICARLGMKLIHSRPYRPQGRGKIERFFNTVTSQFLSEVTVLDAPVQTIVPGTGEDPAGTAVTSIQELNALFTSWVQMVYHRTVHSTTSMTPLARWDAGWEKRRPDRKDPDVIAEAFRWSVTRKVTKTGTVSLQGNTYQVDPALAGARIELIYDPFDLTAPVAVTAAGGVPAGKAVLLQIRRHVHPKAVNAAKDADTGAKNAASGIDYLRLVETRHKTAMTGAPISFEKMAAGAGATGTTGGPR